MRAEELVFWLAAIAESAEIDGGVLCRRHADSMVVPRGWTLDDLRDPDLHLFRPPPGEQRERRRRRRTATHGDHTGEQLRLGMVDDRSETAPDVDDAATGPPRVDDDAERVETSGSDERPHERSDGAGEPWMPSFDTDDDLGGLLAARSPLLSRAFRGDDRLR